MNVQLANTAKKNHIVTQKNQNYRNSVLVKIMFSVIVVLRPNTQAQST